MLQGGAAGENLAAGHANASAVVISWGEERKRYNFAANVFSKPTGHFTQVVWKSTTSLGCGTAKCAGKGGVAGW